MGEKKSWREASQMNGWGRGKGVGALRPIIQPNEILLSCSYRSNVSALTDSQCCCQNFLFIWLLAETVSLPVHQLHMG